MQVVHMETKINLKLNYRQHNNKILNSLDVKDKDIRKYRYLIDSR